MPTNVPPAMTPAEAADPVQVNLMVNELMRKQLRQANDIEIKDNECLLALQEQTAAVALQTARQEFLLHVCALSLAFLCGMFTWRLIVLAKNQRSFW